ncbi:hypothetical protein AAEJ74_04185 [Limnospira fusiformis PMC 851.14]|uniref:Uncharacterized protein n=1 Tax=Limnospira fusiformis PMC 851.14 TaxID=2219512 RepID=A0ABU9EG47_LIMFS
MGSDRLICIPEFVGCRFALPNLRLETRFLKETGFLYPPREKPTLRNGERSPNLYTRICWVSLRFTQPTTRNPVSLRNRVSLPPQGETDPEKWGAIA